jgi:peptidoglycan/LPS O-acetylase OafA/YrhL
MTGAERVRSDTATEIDVRGRGTIGQSFSSKSNSLNFLRLVLASLVIVAHSFVIGGFRPAIQPKWAPGTLGAVAVYGFFGISGYLIAGSALRNDAGRYLWQRVLRIFPAFWVCLIVTAFGFQVIGWFHSNPNLARSCGITCYLKESLGPFGYVFRNLLLWINQPTTSHTLRGVPFPGNWNGSLLSLSYEFMCYLGLGALAVLGLLRRRAAILSLALSVWLVLIVVTAVPSLNGSLNVYNDFNYMNAVTLVPIFLVGAALQVFQDAIPDSAWLALICMAGFIVSFVVPLGSGSPGYTLTSVAMAAPLLVYPLIWFGIHLPCQRIGSRNDYSYGVYIYAFPVQQVLAIWGAYHWGIAAYIVLSLAGTFPFAVASWWAIEKHALRLKKARAPWASVRLRSASAYQRGRPAVPVAASVPATAGDDRALIRPGLSDQTSGQG